MTDLRDRMRIYDQVPAPDYWSEVELRASPASVETAVPARSRGTSLLLAAAMLLALGVGGAALAWSGIMERLVPPVPSVAPVPSGPSGTPLPSLPPVSADVPLAYGLDGDIYLADVDGSNPVRIANGVLPEEATECDSSFYGFGPMWSPDGRYFAYRSDHWGSEDGPECAGTIYLRDADGQLVASFPGAGWLVSWSPDSTRVATWVDIWDTIGVYGIDGVRQALLTLPSRCVPRGDFDPMWSADGQSIWVAGCAVPLDGSPPTPVAEDDPRSHHTAAYSPDRTRVAYVNLEVDENFIPTSGQSLVVAEADGSQERELVSVGVAWGYEVGLVWSPTGDRIAFHGGPLDGVPNEILIVDVASGSVTSLATARDAELIYVRAFSPDGDRILFSRGDADTNSASLWSVNADGSDARLLVSGSDWGDW